LSTSTISRTVDQTQVHIYHNISIIQVPIFLKIYYINCRTCIKCKPHRQNIPEVLLYIISIYFAVVCIMKCI